MFHALRHSSASALIAAGLDAGAVSRRRGHTNPATTLRIYTHHLEVLGPSGSKPGERSLDVPLAHVLSPCPRSCGEVPERSNGAVSKTVVLLAGDRGFESLPLRQFLVRRSFANVRRPSQKLDNHS
jgi:hypothetical protein